MAAISNIELMNNRITNIEVLEWKEKKWTEVRKLKMQVFESLVGVHGFSVS
jgi:hypothetical protein